MTTTGTDGSADSGGGPFWFPAGTGDAPRPRLSRDIEVDVAIVGGGIVGLTVAHLLGQAGRRVAVLEARRVGRQATGKSTAKVTSQHGPIYESLVRDLGEAGARAYAQSNEAAIATIAGLCAALDIECGAARLPAHVYARTAEAAASLEREADAARRLDLPASFSAQADLPFPVAGVLRFDNQMQVDPYRYLQGLARSLGERVHENTRVEKIEHGEPCRLQTADARVTATDVVVATQIPVVPDGMFFAKAFPFAHPMVAARVPPGRVPRGMFISAESPTHSFRTAERDGETFIVAAGGTYKTGHAGEQRAMMSDLRRFLREAFGVEEVAHAWTNEDFGPMDGVPFVGCASSSKPHLLVATGFNAWGFTNGTVAAAILADLLLGRPNPHAALFDATRLRPLRGGPAFLTENTKAGLHLVRDRLLKQNVQALEDIAPGEGGIVEVDGRQLAVVRQPDGGVSAVSAICTHLGCVVGWNGVDRTWDCPCHGSRFDEGGAVLSGPAVSPLEPRRIG